MFDEMPNVLGEMGAVLYDIGRQPRAAHDFFVKYQDRILFGKDSYQPEEYPYYPRQWVAPYIERRRKVGWDLYALLGLTRDNKSGMQAQHARNFAFFDAPVGLIFTIDRVMDQGSWLDYGMFLQTLMIAARARGLDTCPQAAFTQFHRLISETLSIPDDQQVVCGMALGYADLNKAENTLITERATATEFAKFIS
ncbi:MAG: hypothetical protein EBW14_06070 [Oxalobacteraceae bacterium]|nr:hypothetical protein [Oxalobacteraceae bacterium]